MRTGIHFVRALRGFSLCGLASVAVVGTLLAVGCSGGTGNRFDPQVPNEVLRNLSGTWRKTAISALGTRLTCQDPNPLLGSPRTDLIDRGVVMGSCGLSDQITFGAIANNGTGQYTMQTIEGTESGTFLLQGTTLTLLRDTINGSPLGGPKQRIVYQVTQDPFAGLRFTPVEQPVAFQKIDSSQPAFTDEGALITTNVTPVLNGDGSVNVVVLPNTDNFPIVASDLSISVGVPASAHTITATPGIPRMYAVASSFVKL